MKSMAVKKDDGFTLLEVLIAVFILSIGILATTSMFVSAIKANQRARNETVANRLVQNLMEQAKTQTFSSAIADMCTGTGITGCVTSGNTRTGTFQETGNSINTVQYTVSLSSDADPAVALEIITATVTWQDAYGAHSTKAITYVEQ